MANTPIPVQLKPILDKDILLVARPLREQLKSPMVLYGIFVEIVRQYYTDPLNYPLGMQPDIGWNIDVTKTKIWIDTEYQWTDDTPEVRPAIYVKLSDITYESLTGRRDGWMWSDLEQGEKHYSRSGQGQVTFVHIGRTNGETVALGSATQEYLNALAQQIRDDFCFLEFRLVQAKPLSETAKESKERYNGMVVFAFAFQEVWAVKQESPKLKVFDLVKQQ